MTQWRYEYAPAGTLIGLVQRGRGLGARMAAEVPEAAAELVYGCIRWDWRWDGQVDDRHLYLARLVRDLALPVGPVVDVLAGGEDACERATRVLELLALGGSAEAREALQAYVRKGEHWRDVLESVADAWPVEWWDDLADVARERSTGDTEDLWGEPWDRWGLAVPRPEPERGRPAPAEGETSARLLELLADPAELGRWPEAVRVLAGREPEPELLPLVPSLSPAEGEYPLPLLPRAVLKLGVAAVPAAREWAAAGEPWLAGLGHQVLAEYGEAEDIPVLIAELERDWVARAWCGPMYTARGLARFGGAAWGAVSLLRRFWLWTPHSYERAAYLEALGAIEPAGLDQVYVECLWGCEEKERLLAAAHAPDRPEVRERLAYLRDDPMEAAEVRAAAGERLAALT
ncbi:hypothetical protein RMN57_11605 [Kitasatospora sp. CM 4170]|uniref:HEAT repeat domain-containing protein n=1 Tax=Kitasatospora aburaviensis TaxID=67265 RepID=A0ABW1EPQ6_9ACTN|nr:hypothetical protein [Kitasatospora sp. CM 4170]WNM45314.1 hypothetical protein RMN57_11605 [Kitasatospora sp. CM 4170]